MKEKRQLYNFITYCCKFIFLKQIQYNHLVIKVAGCMFVCGQYYNING